MSADPDTPLSTIANVAGILTFVVALLAAAYARFTYLRNSNEEYFRVKASLLWYKTESEFLSDLVTSTPAKATAPERAMREFVLEDLRKLEDRLLELVTETEERARSRGGERDGFEMAGKRDGVRDRGRSWTHVPRSWGFTTDVAVNWLPVRAKALELVRQRDALTARVLFTQMSMVSSRMRELEERMKFDELRTSDSFHRLEDVIQEQRGQIHKLEDLVYRLMYRNKVDRDSVDGSGSPLESPRWRRASIFRNGGDGTGDDGGVNS